MPARRFIQAGMITHAPANGIYVKALLSTHIAQQNIIFNLYDQLKQT